MTDYGVQYWDSCVFFALLTGSQQEQVRVIRELLDMERRGTVEIHISPFVIAEIRSLPQTPAFSQADADVVRELFESDRLVYWVLTPRIAQAAADIGNQHPALLPGDCVHIATALEAKVDVLFTYDGSGARRRPRHMLSVGSQIGTPPLRIMEPFVPQGPLFLPPGLQSNPPQLESGDDDS
jgi:predicted nucleic acid-binding protein